MRLRDKLIYYSAKYDGDSSRIKKALNNNEDAYIINSNETIVVGDALYPNELLALSDPPYVLYYLGDIRLLSANKMSVIGSRTAFEYPLRITKELIDHSPLDWVFVSGLAKGIDAQVHRCALLTHNTIAILGCGIDIIYPRENEELYHLIQTKGLILSEYPPKTAIRKHQFIARNRIIAGLGASLVVMQAATKSGTMSTVEFALNLGKEVFVCPFHIDEVYGSGCNLLLEQGASLLTSDYSLFKL